MRYTRAADPPQPSVRVFIDRGFFYTIPPGGLAADLVRLAGGSNVASSVAPGRPMRPRSLRRAAPQVYLAVVGSGTTLAGLRRSPATRSLPAVRHGRFALIARQVISDDGPRAVDSLETLARALHPTIALGQ